MTLRQIGRTGQFRTLLTAFAMVLFLCTLHPVRAAESDMAERQVTLVDKARGIKASMGFAGSDERRLDVMVWHPVRQKGPLPLVIYSHGTFGFAGNAMHLVRALVDAGYVVAAPDYPLTSRKAYTKISFADVSDVREQVRDLGFIIDSLTADPKLGKLIDASRIGTTGHSLGAMTSYFGSFGARTRDPRIKATAPIAGGDPVQAALDTPMGMAGAGYWPGSVPVLFLTAEQDVFSLLTGPHGIAWARVAGPKYEIIVKDAVHVWFRDGAERPADGKNPDCLFFEANLPDLKLPMCEARYPMIAPERQQEITRKAVVSFFDAYLKDDEQALVHLKSIPERFAEASLASVP